VDERDVKTLENLLPDFDRAQGLILSLDPTIKKIGSVHALPWQDGLKKMGLV
jgi:hypothetical protein